MFLPPDILHLTDMPALGSPFIPPPATSTSWLTWWRVHSDLAWEIIVVNDNSPDGTQDVAAKLARVYGEDKIVSRPCPRPTPAARAQRTLHIPAGPAPARWQTWPRVCADALIVSLSNARPDVA